MRIPISIDIDKSSTQLMRIPKKKPILSEKLQQIIEKIAG